MQILKAIWDFFQNQILGTSSPAALTTVVGVLVEVPVMQRLVKIANNTRGCFEPEKQN